jgi:hypothetical protein
MRWHREGWRVYWRWRSRRRGRGGRRPISAELRVPIRRMASENRFWGQRRIQAELMRLGFKVSARTGAKYMNRSYAGKPSPGGRAFLNRNVRDIWARDFFCVRTIWFQTFYVFFAIRHANREVLHVRVTRRPTAEWVAQQIVECCGWDRECGLHATILSPLTTCNSHPRSTCRLTGPRDDVRRVVLHAVDLRVRRPSSLPPPAVLRFRLRWGTNTAGPR